MYGRSIRIGMALALIGAILVPAAARAEEPKKKDPAKPARAAKRDDSPSRFRPGDRVRLVFKSPSANMYRRAGMLLFVVVSESFEDYKEVDRIYSGDRPLPLQTAFHVALPSGRTVQSVLHGTPATVLDVRPADGLENDTAALRVKIQSGPLAGKAVWVRELRAELVARTPTSEERAALLLEQGQKLERAGKWEPASKLYRELMARHPGTKAAHSAQERLEAISPGPGASAPAPADTSTSAAAPSPPSAPPTSSPRF